MKTQKFTQALLLSIGLSLSGLATAQVAGEEIPPAPDHFVCGADVARKQLIAEHPEVLQTEAYLDNFIREYLSNPQNLTQRSGPIIIPLVFHIVHRGGVENITDQQVLDEIRVLNDDYNKRNADTAQVIPEFQSIIANIGIEFRLANLDPQGNCTNGIEHIYSSQTYEGNDFSKLQPWPRDKYLNVWVVSRMRSGAAGYAYYPGSVESVNEVPMIDGVIILQDYIGTIGTSTAFTSRALTHEIGHCLNLKHVWGDTNEPRVACGDDDVNDTPITKGYTNCPAPGNSMICTPGVKENYQNYMDYSYCSKMFTEGQKARMLATLNSGVAGRSNLWAASNLAATGVENLPATPCAPICDFSANRQFVCLGEKVTFTDDSYNGDITARTWTFENADIATSSDKQPQVLFNQEGWQKVTLEVVNAQGSSRKEQTLVYVGDPLIQFAAPYYNTFDDPSEVSRFWVSNNIDRDEPHFQLTNLAGNTGNTSMLLNNYMSRTDHNQDELITPAFNCTGLNSTNGKVSFWYSYASWSNNFNAPLADSIAVYISKTCGSSWVRIYADGSNAVVNAGYHPAYFIPENSTGFWKKVNITIPPNGGWFTTGVRFKVVVFGAHNSNNFYLDDWNLGLATTGIEEDFSSSLSVMPNPFNSNVQIQGLNDGKYNINVLDITGRQVLALNAVSPVAGNVNLDLSAVDTKGIYLVKISNGTSTGTLKLVKE